MPPRRTFYDPLVEAPAAVEEPPSSTIAGIAVEKPGLYLLVDDVAAYLRGMADNWGSNDASVETNEGRIALADAAERFEQFTIESAIAEGA